jgi:hypothetical protein
MLKQKNDLNTESTNQQAMISFNQRIKEIQKLIKIIKILKKISLYEK